jgi:MFS family permease
VRFAGIGSRTFASLRLHRNYRLFFAGQVFSMSGNQMQMIADVWLILQLTDSAFWIGVLAVAQFLPFTLFGLLAGVIVDRVDPHKLVIATQFVLGSLASGMAVLVLTGAVRVWHVLVFAAVAGCTRVVEQPAQQTLVLQMVGRGELPNAIALTASLRSAGRIVGPAIGGVLIAAVGTGWVYAINAVTFLPVLAALVALRRPEFYPLRREGRPRIFHGIGEAIRHVRHTPVALTILAAVLVLSFCPANSNVLVPALAHDMLEGGASLFGGLMACMGLGATLGALIAASRGRASAHAFLLGAAGMGVSQLLIAAYPTAATGAILLFTMGVCYTLWTANGNAILQLTAPDRMQGRASSLFTLAFLGISPFGGLFTGALAGAGGKLAYGVGGTLAVLTALLAGARLRRLEEALGPARDPATVPAGR